MMIRKIGKISRKKPCAFASDAVRIWVENTLPVYARVAPVAGMFLAESELTETWDRSEKLRMYGFRHAMAAIAPKGVFRAGCDLDTAAQVMNTPLGAIAAMA